MTQEDKKLLLKDLSARLPYGIMCHANEINLDGELLFINKVYNIVAVYNDKATGKFDTRSIVDFDTCPIADIKPYLRPLSSMTEEEARELGALHYIKNILSVKVTNVYIDYIVDDGVCSTETRTIWCDELVLSVECLDWLNSKHFDYRGLILNGIAIEVTDENNPYK